MYILPNPRLYVTLPRWNPVFQESIPSQQIFSESYVLAPFKNCENLILRVFPQLLLGMLGNFCSKIRIWLLSLLSNSVLSSWAVLRLDPSYQRGSQTQWKQCLPTRGEFWLFMGTSSPLHRLWRFKEVCRAPSLRISALGPIPYILTFLTSPWWLDLPLLSIWWFQVWSLVWGFFCFPTPGDKDRLFKLPKRSCGLLGFLFVNCL